MISHAGYGTKALDSVNKPAGTDAIEAAFGREALKDSADTRPPRAFLHWSGVWQYPASVRYR